MRMETTTMTVRRIASGFTIFATELGMQNFASALVANLQTKIHIMAQTRPANFESRDADRLHWFER
jgi:hypothetical protein